MAGLFSRLTRKIQTPPNEPVPEEAHPQTDQDPHGENVTTLEGFIAGADAPATGDDASTPHSKKDEWSDPPAVDLAAAETIVEDGRTPLSDEQALALLGVRLSRGVAFMGDRDDIPLVVHKHRDHGAWAWIDKTLITAASAPAPAAGGGALHVALGPLLGGVDAAEVNPLKPVGRRAHPSVPGALAHAAAHLKHTRLDEAVLGGMDWEVRAAATMLEEIRCEAAQVRERPWDAVYLRASARLWTVPEGDDQRWRTAYLALMTLGRRAAGVLLPEDTDPVLPVVSAVFSVHERRRLTGVWVKALRLEDGDTQGLVDLGARWVQIVGPRQRAGTFPDPCAARSWHMSVPPDDERGGDEGDAGSDSGGQDGAAGETGPDAADAGGGESSGAQGGGADGQQETGGAGDAGGSPDSSSSGGEDGSNDAQGPGDGEDAAGRGSGPAGETEGAGGSTSAAATGSLVSELGLDWDDPLTDALGRVARSAHEGARSDLEEQRRQERHREEVIRSATRPLDEGSAQAAQRRAEAEDVYARNREGLLVKPAAHSWRDPSSGDKKLCRDLEQALRRAKFRERGKTSSSFDRPPGRMVGRDMVQRMAQQSQGRLPTVRPWRRQIYASTPSPMIHALILADKSGSMEWVMGPTSVLTWAFSRVIHAVGGKATALTFGRDVRVLADSMTVLRRIPVYRSKDTQANLAAGLRAGDGRMNLSAARGVKIVFILSDGAYSQEGCKRARRELTRMIDAGVKIIWITLGIDEEIRKRSTVLTIFDWAPKGVQIVPISMESQVGTEVVRAMTRSLVRETYNATA